MIYNDRKRPGVFGGAGELGDKENSVYGEKAEVMLAGEVNIGDSVVAIFSSYV